jgi:diaminopimelate epimerase
MDRLRFSKMHGAGNDFVVIDCISQAVEMTPDLARAIADRHRGIGCDQILLVGPAPQPGVDFSYRIFNADGSEVEQCGNGARCFVRFVHERGLTTASAIRVQTRAGVIAPRLEPDGQVCVDMGVPAFAPERIPFDAAGLSPVDLGAGAQGWPIDVGGTAVIVSLVSMGNPHAVQQVEDLAQAPVQTQGPLIEHHPRFPARVNAGYMQRLDRHRIRLRVFERGAGETLSCGTGACAAAVSGIRQGILDSPVDVHTRGGLLRVAWEGQGQPVLMTGPAVLVYDGTVEPQALLQALPDGAGESAPGRL